MQTSIKNPTRPYMAYRELDCFFYSLRNNAEVVRFMLQVIGTVQFHIIILKQLVIFQEEIQSLSKQSCI